MLWLNSFIPKRPVITAYPRMPEAFVEAEAMSAYLKERGIEAPFGSLYDENLRKRVRRGEFDMLIIAGGDGSVLRAGHLCAPSNVPILGVNLGTIGFLIQVEREEWREYFDKLLNGEAWIENRMMLHVEHIRAGEVLGSWDALNEVVVARGQMRPSDSVVCFGGWTSVDELCCGWAHRFHTDWFNSLCSRRRRAHSPA